MEDSFFQKMIAEYEQNTGLEVEKTSDIGIKFRIVSSFLAQIDEKLEEAEKQTVATTATEEYLDYHGESREVFRKKGDRSLGQVTFVSKKSFGSDIKIEKGTLLETNDLVGVFFETTKESVLKNGTLSLDISCRSLEAGEDKNISPFKISHLVTAIEGVESVINNDSFKDGTDDEEDDKYRIRILDNYRSLSNGGNIGYYKNILLEFNEILDVLIIFPESNVVKIILYSKEIIAENRIREIKDYIIAKKEIGKEIILMNSRRKKVNIYITVRTNDRKIFQEISDSYKKRVSSYIEGLKIDENLYLSKIVGLGFLDPDIIDVKIKEPFEDILVKEDEKIFLEKISVERLGKEVGDEFFKI